MVCTHDDTVAEWLRREIRNTYIHFVICCVVRSWQLTSNALIIFLPVQVQVQSNCLWYLLVHLFIVNNIVVVFFDVPRFPMSRDKIDVPNFVREKSKEDHPGTQQIESSIPDDAVPLRAHTWHRGRVQTLLVLFLDRHIVLLSFKPNAVCYCPFSKPGSYSCIR